MRARARVANVLVALVVLSSVLVAPLMGSTVAAAAIDETNECDPLDKAVWLLSLGYYNSGKEDGTPICDPVILYDEASSTIQQMEDNEAAQERTDIYQAGLSVNQDLERLRTESSNEQQDLTTVAFMKYQAAVENAIANNKTKSEAKAAGQQAVGDFIAVHQTEFLYAWEQKSIQMGSLAQISQNESLAYESQLYDGANTMNITDTYGPVTYSLANGSTLATTTIGYYSTGAAAVQPVIIDDNMNVSMGAAGYRAGGQISYPSLDSEHASYTMADVDATKATYKDYWEISANAKSNGNSWVESIWPDVTNGTYSAGQAGSCLALASQYKQEYDQTGAGVYATGVLACSGYQTLNLSSVGTMTISVNGNTYEGFLLSQSAPAGGEWVAGNTYDPSVISGAQLFAPVSGDLVDLDKAGVFTIEKITAKDGSTLNSTAPEEYQYMTTSNEEYQTQMALLDALRAAIEAREPSSGGGGGSSAPSTILGYPAWMVAAAAALLLVVISAVRG